MSGGIPKRVLNGRIGATIEKNQTPMQAGLAPRVGKSGASIRLYYSRVDGCCDLCGAWNDPIVIKKRYLIPGKLEQNSTFYNSAGIYIQSGVFNDPANWAVSTVPNASNYSVDGDQTDRIYYAIVLNRDVNPVIGNTVPTKDLKLGYRRFRDNLGNTVFPGGPGANYNVPGTTDGQFTYEGVPNTIVQGTVFKPIQYGATGAMTYGINGEQIIPAADYTIVSSTSTTPWSVPPFGGDFLETDRTAFPGGVVNSGWRIGLNGLEIDNPTNPQPRFSGPGKSHWGPVNKPATAGFFGVKHNPNHVSADNVFIVHNPVHFGGYTLLFNISQAILESSDIRALTTGDMGGNGNFKVGNILSGVGVPPPFPTWTAGAANDYSAKFPGASVAGPGKGLGPLQFWTNWGSANGAVPTNNDPWMALHWFVYNNGISTFYDPSGTFKLQTNNNINSDCSTYDGASDFLPSAGVGGFSLKNIGPDNDSPNLEWWYQQSV
jgi:hypothetical protein